MASALSLLNQVNKINKQMMNFNSAEALKERNFSKYMSMNSHQMEVEDLKKAGLNPVLSANSGANAYSGASANANLDNGVGAVASLIGSEMSANAMMNSAAISANASKKVAQINADATKYKADSERLSKPWGIATFGLGKMITPENTARAVRSSHHR